jgi:hypothetical protein
MSLQSPPPKPQSRLWLLIAGGLVAVLAAVVGAGFFIVSSRGTSGVSDLRSGQLQPSDLPMKFRNQNVQIYPNYVKQMVLNGSTSFRCNRPPSLIPVTWTQGMIRALYNDDKHFMLQCGWLLKTEDDARTAFQTSQSADRRLSGYTPLASKVGDESYALTNTLPSSTTYYLVFRHTNAVMGLVSTSGATADLTPDQFLQLGQTANSRLK